MADRLGESRGAREHNLRGVDLDLPRDSLVVFTGLSGSGKSSLAFDTIFAEGQRRYVESLSAYARQFLGQMDKPDVDFIEGLSPAVSIDQKSTNRNPRSTVGTITEVYDYLRLLYARAGVPHCPVCGHVIEKQTPQQIVDQVLAMEEGSRFQVLAPVVRTRKGEFVDLFANLQAQGYSRVMVDGTVHQLTDPPKLKKQEKHDIAVVVDRLSVKGSAKQRLTDSVETALRLADGLVVLDFVDLARRRPAPRAPFLRADGLPQRPPALARRPRAAHVLLQLALRRVPRLHRHRDQEGGRPGARGTRPGAEPRRQGAIAPWAGGQSAEYFGRLLEGAGQRGRLPDGHAVAQAAAAAQKAVLHGSEDQVHVRYRNRYGRERSYYANYEGVIPFLERRLDQTESESQRERYEGYMRDVPCPACKGARLKPEVLAVTLAHRNQGDRSIAEVIGMSVAECSEFLGGMQLDARQAMIAGRVLKEVQARLGFLLDVGLRLPLARPRGRHAVRRRGPAHPAGHADRVRAGRRAVRARRAVDRAAPARQPAADRDAHPAARPGQHAHRRRARRGHHPGRRLGRRHRPGRGRARRRRSSTAAPVAELEAHDTSLTGAYLSGRRSIPVPDIRRPIDREAASSRSSARASTTCAASTSTSRSAAWSRSPGCPARASPR